MTFKQNVYASLCIVLCRIGDTLNEILAIRTAKKNEYNANQMDLRSIK